MVLVKVPEREVIAATPDILEEAQRIVRTREGMAGVWGAEGVGAWVGGTPPPVEPPVEPPPVEPPTDFNAYVITRLDDYGAGDNPKVGTVRYAYEELPEDEHVWITNVAEGGAVGMVPLVRPLRGRGGTALAVESLGIEALGYRGQGLAFSVAEDVLIRGLQFGTFVGTGNDDGDALRLSTATNGYWVDLCVFSGETGDESLDVNRTRPGQCFGTVSRNVFRRAPGFQEFSLLVQSQDGNDQVRVTVHDNQFEGTWGRNPLLQGVYGHTYNNHIGWRWGGLEIQQREDRGQIVPNVLSENDTFDAAATFNDGDRRRAVHHHGQTGHRTKVINPTTLNGAVLVPDQNPNEVWDPRVLYGQRYIANVA